MIEKTLKADANEFPKAHAVAHTCVVLLTYFDVEIVLPWFVNFNNLLYVNIHVIYCNGLATAQWTS